MEKTRQNPSIPYQIPTTRFIHYPMERIIPIFLWNSRREKEEIDIRITLLDIDILDFLCYSFFDLRQLKHGLYLESTLEWISLDLYDTIHGMESFHPTQCDGGAVFCSIYDYPFLDLYRVYVHKHQGAYRVASSPFGLISLCKGAKVIPIPVVKAGVFLLNIIYLTPISSFWYIYIVQCLLNYWKLHSLILG